jgi:hypothetical protein
MTIGEASAILNFLCSSGRVLHDPTLLRPIDILVGKE